MVAGRPVSIQSPARINPSIAVRAAGRGGASAASENVARFSRTTRLFRSVADRAGVAGSPDHKFVSGAPLRSALAGALIGRIDNGLPFGIGDQTSIIAPASGLLYLGTNDDYVNDNSGQFQVTIAPGR